MSPLNTILENKKVNNANLIQTYLMAIDNKNKEDIKFLYNENNSNNVIEKDIVFEMYNENKLNLERLQFIVENCTTYLNISSSLIKKLMKVNSRELLEILFKNHLKFFDNTFILNLLKHYESKTSVTDTELSTLINSDKYKISTELGEHFERYDSSYYLFNACKSGNEAAVKFLLEHGADMTIKDKDNRIAFAWACVSGNLNLVKYLVQLGADINNETSYGLTHIFNACNSGNLNLVKYLIGLGADINKATDDGRTPIFNACSEGHITILKYLVELGADINKETDDGWTPIFYACNYGHISIVKYLVEHGTNINKENNNGETALFFASLNGYLDVVKYLVEHGAEINKNNNNGWTPLLTSCQNGHRAIIRYLVEQGADINKEIAGGWTPLFRVCQDGYEDIVKFLVEHGADIDKGNHDGVTPLYVACQNGHEGIVKYLVEYGADINKENSYSRTPFFSACFSGYENIVKFLVEHGADINKVNNNGITPFYVACQNGNIEVIRRLVECGAEINKEKDGGFTPLYIASQHGHTIVVKYLVEHGADIDKENNVGWTSLFSACQNGHIAIVKYLVELGTNINKEDNDGVTPLSLTCEKGDEAIIQYLIKQGANINKRFINKYNSKIIKLLQNYEKEKRKMIYQFYSRAIQEYKTSFESKIKQLRSLDEMRIMNSYTFIEIDRNNLFIDAFNGIMTRSPQELKNRPIIVYKGEDGVDTGGLLRDFFYQISKEMGNPNYSLFKYSHEDSYELEINPNSGFADSNHLQYFRFIGRIIGLAIFTKQHLSVSFALPLYKRLLNIPLEPSDLEYIDHQLFQNLQKLKDSDGVEYLYLNFIMDIEDCFGNRKTIELKPNGANIDVTDSNKNEYINLVIENKLNNTNDEKQLNALKQGFYEIIPNKINSIFDDVDLKFLISGINIIDVDDWENNTDYEGYEKDDITVINFWKCVRNFSNEDRTKLLLFATGNSQVPVTGFKDLQGGENIIHFKLKKSGTENDLPISHTCFNRIDLPPYTSLDVLEQKLLYAITEGIDGFTIG